MNKIIEETFENLRKGVNLETVKDNDKLSKYYNDLFLMKHWIDTVYLDMDCYIFLRDFEEMLEDIDLKWKDLPNIISSIEFDNSLNYFTIGLKIHMSKNKSFNKEEKEVYVEEIKGFLGGYFAKPDVDFNEDQIRFWCLNVKKIDCSKNIENQLLNSLPNNYYQIKKSINEFNSINEGIETKKPNKKRNNKL